MSIEKNPQTAETNSRLWGARAHDWANIQEGTVLPVYKTVFDRIGLSAGACHLDVGCGAGMATQVAFERGARVSGLDAAESLLAIARTRVPSGEFQRGELESLPFPDDTFDLVTGFNSFQYAGNPSVALEEAKRVARKGGDVVIVTWGEPEGMEAAALISAIKALLPAPPPGTPGPFALSNEAALLNFATSADLSPTEVFDVASLWHYPNLATALRGLMSSGVAIRAIEHTSEAAVELAYSEAVEPYRQADGTFMVNSTFRCLVASA